MHNIITEVYLHYHTVTLIVASGKQKHFFPKYLHDGNDKVLRTVKVCFVFLESVKCAHGA
jgi:hypothetical protein